MFERRQPKLYFHASLLSIVRSALVPAAMIAVLLVGRRCVAVACLERAVRMEVRERRPEHSGMYVCPSIEGKTFCVFLTADGEIEFDGQLVPGLPDLRCCLAASSSAARDARVVIEADPTRCYGDWLGAIDTVRGAGFPDVTVLMDREWCRKDLPALN